MVRVQQRQDVPSIPPDFTGALTASGTVLSSAFIADTTAASGGQVSAPPLAGTNSVTLTSTIPGPTDAPPTDVPPAQTGAATTSSNSKSSIPMGTVIGACVGAFLFIALIVFFVFVSNQRSRRKVHHRKGGSNSPFSDNRNDRQNTERRKSGREVWVKMDDKEEETYEKYAMKPTKDSFVQRSITVKSAKSTKTFKSFGAGLGFAKTFATTDIPPQLEFTDQEMGSGRALPLPRPAPFARENDPVSWGGETLNGAHDSFLNLKRTSGSLKRVDGAMSPNIVVSRQTPETSKGIQHRWEEAEVVSPIPTGHFDEEEDNFSKFTSEDKGKGREKPMLTLTIPGSEESSSNPFLGADDNKDQNRQDPFNDSFEEKDTEHVREQRAMQSLIAALNISHEEAQKRLSAEQQAMRESGRSFGSNFSKYSDALGEENIDRFPLPPSTVVPRR